MKANETIIRNLTTQEKQDQSLEFGIWIDGLLSLEGDKSAKRLIKVLELVEECQLTMYQLKIAFIMYVKGEFTFEPRDNYLTAVLFSKIINSYLKQSNQKNVFKEAKSNILELMEEDYERILVDEFNQIKKTGKLNQMRLYLYDYLNNKKILENDKNILSIIKETAIENLQNITQAKIEIPVNKDEHNENKHKEVFSESEILVEEKNIILIRFFNQFTTNDQLLNKLRIRCFIH